MDWPPVEKHIYLKKLVEKIFKYIFVEKDLKNNFYYTLYEPRD